VSKSKDCQLHQVAKDQARCLLEGPQNQAAEEQLQIAVALGCSVPRGSPELCGSRHGSQGASCIFLHPEKLEEPEIVFEWLRFSPKM